MSSKSKPNPLPLGDTLRDLALLRASECDLSSLLPPKPLAYIPRADASSSESEQTQDSVNESVEKSYEFAREARAVMKLLHREEVVKQGSRLEDVRSGLEDLLRGLEDSKRPS
ncbi:uncharacterized protein FIBRA_06550 [Fibroporia radiculosa]|uniref:Uncharacterized protein n=1 Tax=Fibroporia radiculosa TaxID=599839 RepID=J4IBB6_9APHY|nr:uncharacterized protein FIBRA_06550 [Fibroporia radiculosa]CCM04376.1 predicted protein [Fibroporia radiculosa]